MNRDSRLLVWAAAGYGAALVMLVALGVVLFGDLYGAPAPEPGSEFSPSYRLFLTVAGGVVALSLVALAWTIGMVTGRWWAGLCSLAAGLVVNIGVLSVLPWVQFPHDQYAAGAAWAFIWIPVCLGLWALVAGVGLLHRPRHA